MLEEYLDFRLVTEAVHERATYPDGRVVHSLRVNSKLGWHAVEGATLLEMVGRLPVALLKKGRGIWSAGGTRRVE